MAQSGRHLAGDGLECPALGLRSSDCRQCGLNACVPVSIHRAERLDPPTNQTRREVYGEKYEDHYIIPSLWLSLWSVAFPIGTMIGAAAGGWIQDLTGRKTTLGIGSIISIAAIGLCYGADTAADKRSAMFGGKLLEGLAVGLIICSTQTYLSEVTPARLRGPTFALFPAFQLLGQLIAAIIVLLVLNVPGKKSYRVALATEWPFSVIPLVLAALVPESPVW